MSTRVKAPAATTDASTDPAGEGATPTIDELLGLADQVAARRPVAARVVAMTDDDSVGSKALAGTLTADVALTTRVMKLANSAYFGLGGRVRSVSFAVTVVGFSTVRAIAATAAAGLDLDDVLPATFWPRARTTGVACGALAHRFALPTPDAFCLGLLSGLGQAVLYQHDVEGYRDLLEQEDVLEGGRRALVTAEQELLGFRHTQVSAAALAAWRFPRDFSEALDAVDDDRAGAVTTPWSRCLATAVEAAGRLVDPGGPTDDVLALSGGAITEDRLATLLPSVRESVMRSEW